MIYYVYRITDDIHDHEYIGKRRCPEGVKPEDDAYMSSSYILNGRKGKYEGLFKKYGVKNFTKEILHVCSSIKEVNFLEKKEIRQRKKIGKAEYNIAEGGDGGDTFSNLSEEKKKKRFENLQKTLNSNDYKIKMIKKLLMNEKFMMSQTPLCEKRSILLSMKPYFHLMNEDLLERWKFLMDLFKNPSGSYKINGVYVVSEDHKEKMSKDCKERFTGREPWHKGKTGVYSKNLLDQWSEKHKEKKYTLEEKLERSGIKNKNRGRKLTEEQRKSLMKPKLKYTASMNVPGRLQKNRVRCIETGEEFESIKEAMKKYGNGHIGSVCRGERSTACGHTWEYA
jgi:hypothetical protein